MSNINPIARFAIERRVTMMMAVLGVLVVGWMSLKRLPLEYLPTFSSSNVNVSVSYPSSSPEEVERLIAQPLEDSLGTINGIETMSARASANQASLNITFVDGTDMDMAAVDVRDRVDRVRHRLPADIDRVRIRRFQSTDIPVLRFHLSAKWPRDRLFQFVEDSLQPRLERLPGVAQVGVRGIRSASVLVDLDRARMQAHRINIRQLTERIRSDNQNLSAGEITEGSQNLQVRAIGEFATLDELRDLPIDDGGLRLADVADVSYSFPRQAEFNYLNGAESLTVQINKVSTANLLEVVDGVKAELDEIRQLPEAEGLAIRIYRDSSTDVRKGLSQLRNTGLFGGALAIGAVFLFMRRFRTTLLVAIAIPVSVIGTFVIMYFLRLAGLSDITLNVVSLAGLMLALGMLVDNSIVVIESIFRHRNDLGEDARTAALRGTSEVALPIGASTATTLCVFLPLIFLGSGGWMQTSFRNIATTVSIVIAASLLVALTVVPLVASRLLVGQEARKAPLIDRLVARYGRILRFTLRHRLVFVISAGLMIFGSWELSKTIERTFAQRSEERQVTLKVSAPRQYSEAQVHALYDELYQLVDANRDDLDVADITYEYDLDARSGGRDNEIELYLTDEEESRITTGEARDRLRKLLPTKPGVDLSIAQGRGRHGSSGIEVELMGDNLGVLELLARNLVQELEATGMFKDVDTSLESGDVEIHVQPRSDRVMQSALSSQDIGRTVSTSLTDRALSHFKTGDHEIDLVVQFEQGDRETLEQLKNVPVFGGTSQLPLGAVADFALVAGPKSIERENHRAKVTISANTESPGASFGAMRQVSTVMESFAMPPGYEWGLGRWNRYQQRDQVMSEFAIGFALLLVYLLMAALFESFTQPFTILFSVPFAIVGVALVLKLAKQPLDTMATVGVIILIGVVVNNAIVLLDHINQLRKSGLPRTRAIVEGGQHRLRPILITAVTTILGLLPMVAPLLFPQWLGPIEGRAATWAPIGLVILGGLTTSTFLTLLVIPTVYSLIDDLTAFARRVVRA